MMNTHTKPYTEIFILPKPKKNNLYNWEIICILVETLKIMVESSSGAGHIDRSASARAK